MTLPFSQDHGKRTFCCFCCGKEYIDFEIFKNHIIETHELGRDYVLCPLSRCGSPVRDIKTHFSARHPHDVIPKHNGPNRAIVWKDQRGSKGKKKSKRPTFREGHFVSIKNNGKEFYYRSSYECEVLECLEQIPEIIAYDVEPFKEGIPYLHNGKMHHYFPDLSIHYMDGVIEIWEIKPQSQIHLEVNTAKWAAANTYCQARGWNFIVITELGISKLKNKILLS